MEGKSSSYKAGNCMHGIVVVLKLLMDVAQGLPEVSLAKSDTQELSEESRIELGNGGMNRPLSFDAVINSNSSLSSHGGKKVFQIEGRFPVYAQPPSSVLRLPPGSRFVPYRLLLRGQRAVPIQRDTWSCGANSAARFSAMLENEVDDYETFKSREPTYGGFLGIPRIGANPEHLQDFLRYNTNLTSYKIGQRCSRRFAPQFEILMRSLDLGRPALVLFMDSGTWMHWVNLVARNDINSNWTFMDTDGGLFELTGGDDELKHRMNMDNCAAQRFNFVERFNSVTTTECSDFNYSGGPSPNRRCRDGRISD
jgi:hypothetical protein